MTNHRTWLGIIITIVWIGFWLFLIYQTWPDVKNLGLNEWCVFLASAIAPIAFLWLILGYFRQGYELRQNTEILRLQQDQLAQQVKEMSNLTRQTKRLTAAVEWMLEVSSAESTDQFEFEKHLAQPDFYFSDVEFGQRTILKGVNLGGIANDLSVKIEGVENVEIVPGSVLGFKEDVVVSIVFPVNHPLIHKDFFFIIHYSDNCGDSYWFKFVCSTESNNIKLIEKSPDLPT